MNPDTPWQNRERRMVEQGREFITMTFVGRDYRAGDLVEITFSNGHLGTLDLVRFYVALEHQLLHGEKS